MHYKKLLKAHKAFYSGEYRAQNYDEYMHHKDWQSWKSPVLPDIEVTKLWDFILSWDYHFKGNKGKFKLIYQEVYPIIQGLEQERIENIDFANDEVKTNIQEIFDKVARCPLEDRYESTDASKILHTILPNYLLCGMTEFGKEY